MSVNISSATLAGQIGIIQPRKYSIASSPENLMDNSDLCLIAGVHRFQSESGSRSDRALTIANEMEIGFWVAKSESKQKSDCKNRHSGRAC